MIPAVSIIIPSRDDRYLQKTIDDLLAKAQGEVAIIVILDGYWPKTPIKNDPRVTVIHQGTIFNNPGMRESINRGVSIAKSKFIMKIDEHCLVDGGYDVKLAADCEDNWVVVPRRWRLDPDNWAVIEDGRPPVDYMYLAYPGAKKDDLEWGLHGSLWNQRYHERKDILIDDTMSWQGSCWFMTRKHWDKTIRELDTESYGPFTQEPQEIGNKTWLSGGRLVVNKKTWYAHWHKGKIGKGYGFSNEQYAKHTANMKKGRQFCVDYWMNNRWPERIHDFEWLIDKFWPIPTWPDDWKKEYYGA